MTRKPNPLSLLRCSFLMLSLLMSFTPTAMAAARQNSKTTAKQPSSLTLRGKTPQETRKFLDAIRQVESCSAVVNNSNVVGNYQGEV